MKRRHRLLSVTLTLFVLASASAESHVRDILDASGVKGGLIVHVGCGDGNLTAELHVGDSYLIHGLDTDPESVRKARQTIASLGLQGKVGAETYDGKSLPLIDNVASLILVTSEEGPIARDELLRVLTPRGVALVRLPSDRRRSDELDMLPVAGLDGWLKLVKPVPAETDEWSHFLHGPDNNAVVRDTVVGPPRRLQWKSDPRWLRYHHTLASISALVTSGGRIFYILDESPAASIAVAPRWFLYARDAYSGVFLWKRPIPSWASHTIKFRSGPVDLPRRLVASANRVFATLQRGGPVCILDAATGNTLNVLEGTEGAEEILLDDGVLVLARGTLLAQQQAGANRRRAGKKAQQPQEKKATRVGRDSKSGILALNPGTGKLLWQSDQTTGGVLPLTLAVSDQRVFFQRPNQLVCLGLKDGAELWQTKRTAKLGASFFAPTVVVAQDVVLSADGSGLEAFSTDRGTPLWGCPCQATFRSPVDVLVIDGLVWLGQEFSEGRDLHSGEIKKQNLAAGSLPSAGHHHRCYRNKATDRYIIGGYRGLEFYDLQGDDHSRNNWVRGVCQYGIMPANGLNYVPPDACGCYPEARLFGFYALAGAGHQPDILPAPEALDRLEEGPAYNSVRPSSSSVRPSSQWPTFRHDPQRSGSSEAAIPDGLKQAWATKVGGNLSAVTAADGRLLVSAMDRHTVHCLDAESGQPLWSYSVGGRVDSPPTIHKGLALFGSADGFVYCLRMVDGELAWRFLAAPVDRRTVVRDRVESVWPVHGSVLVLHDTAYVSAGRSSWLDGGIRLYGLNAVTGQVVCETEVQAEHPDFQQSLAKRASVSNIPQRPDQNDADWKTVVDPDRSDAFSMGGGAISDVLVSDGDAVYLRQLKFNQRLELQGEKGRHLFSTSSLLDGNENHRSHWMLGNFEMVGLPVAYSWIANRREGRQGVGFTVPYGLMLSFDDTTAWCVWRDYSGGPPVVFARPSQPRPEDTPPRADFGPLASQSAPGPWSAELETRPRAMLRAGDQLLLAGRPRTDTPAALVRQERGLLVALSTQDGSHLATLPLDSPSVWDGLAAANGQVFLACEDGTVRGFK